MPTTAYGQRFLPGNPFGVAIPSFELDPANIDTVAVGTGSEPMPLNTTDPGANSLTNEVDRVTAPHQDVYYQRSPNDETAVTMGIEFVHGRRLPLGTPITEAALIASNPQTTTDPDGNVLNEAVVAYEFGTAVPLGSETTDTSGTAPSSTKIGVTIDMNFPGGI